MKQRKQSQEERLKPKINYLTCPRAIDALTKAYMNHYEHGIFILGDRDFVPLIDAIKDAGKKTLCLASLSKLCDDLLRRFDKRYYIEDEELKLLQSK